MHPETILKLLGLNRQFYQTFAVQFSATRRRIQPGVRRVLARIPPDADLLDLGCGNGELARQLAHGGHQGRYLGLDFSPGLIAACQEIPLPARFTFRRADLSADWQPVVFSWAADRPPESDARCSFSTVLAFAVLHHIPGRDSRLQILRGVHDLLEPGGQFIHSEWQFLNSPRLRQRIQPWELAGLSDADVEAGDYLMDWRSGGRGLRYVHHFDGAELAALAAEAGFHIVEEFGSDGESGDLGLYQMWARA